MVRIGHQTRDDRILRGGRSDPLHRFCGRVQLSLRDSLASPTSHSWLWCTTSAPLGPVYTRVLSVGLRSLSSKHLAQVSPSEGRGASSTAGVIPCSSLDSLLDCGLGGDLGGHCGLRNGS